MNNMKTVLTAIIVLFSSHSFAASYDIKSADEIAGDICTPGEIVFYGLTERGSGQVAVCALPNDRYRYLYGKIGHQPEKTIVKTRSEIAVVIDDRQGSSEEQVCFGVPDYVYCVGNVTDYQKKIDLDRVLVIPRKDRDNTTTVRLDSETVVNRIREMF